jgi:hypothetical protein
MRGMKVSNSTLSAFATIAVVWVGVWPNVGLPIATASFLVLALMLYCDWKLGGCKDKYAAPESALECQDARND